MARINSSTFAGALVKVEVRASNFARFTRFLQRVLAASHRQSQ